MPGEHGPRRYLIATAVTRHHHDPTLDRPELVADRDRIIDLFTRRFGYEHVPEPGLDPTERELTSQLRKFCRSPDRREDDLLAIYLACHGEVLDEYHGGGHVLLTADSDPTDLADALPTGTLAQKLLANTRIRRLLLLLDSCYSGHGTHELAARALDRITPEWGTQSGAGLLLLSSAHPSQQAVTGAFPRLLERAVDSLTTAGHGPRTLALDALVQSINADSERPAHQSIHLSQLALNGDAPPFLPNPRHDSALLDTDLAVQREAEWRRHGERREVELRTHLLRAAMANGNPGSQGWWFHGRRRTLTDLTHWLRATRPGGTAMAVTGAPGSGKSAVLGLVAARSNATRRSSVPVDALGLKDTPLPDEGAVTDAIYAQNLTDQQILEGIGAALRKPAGSVQALLRALPEGEASPPVVLIDALDEAATPDSLCREILRPLIEHGHSRLRLLLGTRPHLLTTRLLGLTDTNVLDLDSAAYADPDAVRAYTLQSLLRSHPDSPYLTCKPALRARVADLVAEAAHNSFLIARITAGTLAAADHVADPQDPAWRQQLPRQAGEAVALDLAERLGGQADRARRLLHPLAYAQGRGLPWEDLWAPLADAVAGCPHGTHSDEDLLWLREVAGSYIIETTEADRSAYRLYHQSLAEYLREGMDETAVHARMTRALLRRVPGSAAAGGRDWARAHPYLRAYLAEHAALGGLLEELVADPEYLVHAEPDGLVRRLPALRSPSARATAVVYLASVGEHRDTAPQARRHILALDAARYGLSELCEQLNHRAAPGLFHPVSASSGGLSPALRNTFTGHSETVTAVTCTVVDGRPVVISGDQGGEIRMWNLESGRPIGTPIDGHRRGVTSLTCTVVEGRPLLVSGGNDYCARIWDLTTGRPVGNPLTGHEGPGVAVACTERNGLPVAVTTGGNDATLYVWDLMTQGLVDRGFTGPASRRDVVNHLGHVACLEMNGRQVVVSGKLDGTVQAWDLITLEPVGTPFHAEGLAGMDSMACTSLDGRPVFLTSGAEPRTTLIRDLETGTPLGAPLPGTVVDCAVREGLPSMAVLQGSQGARVWDLQTRTPSGPPLPCSLDVRFQEAAFARLHGDLVLVTSGPSHQADGVVQVWDLNPLELPAPSSAAGPPAESPHDGAISVACGMRLGRPVVAICRRFGSVHLWDPTSGHDSEEALGYDASAVTSTMVNGRRTIVIGGRDGSLQAIDLRTGRPLLNVHTQAHRGPVWVVRCAVLDDRTIAVTKGADRAVWVWELGHGPLRGREITGHGSEVGALACTTVNGASIAVTEDNGLLRFWDLRNGALRGSTTEPHGHNVAAIACTTLQGAPVVVSSGFDGTIRTWKLADRGTPIGAPLTHFRTDPGSLKTPIPQSEVTGSGRGLSDVACAVLDGRAYAATSGIDRTVRIWDLDAHACIQEIPLPQAAPVLALTDTGTLACAWNHHAALFSWRPLGPGRTAPPLPSPPPPPPPPVTPPAAVLPSSGTLIQEIRIAKIFDARDEAGRAVFGPDHPRLADAASRARVLAYLKNGKVCLATAGRDRDRYDPRQGQVVPMSFRTDGFWVWSEALAYYLEQYGFAPEQAFLDHMRACDYRAPAVSREQAIAASEIVLGDRGRR